MAGENGFVPVFIPWFTDPDYREPVPANFERTPDEEELAEKYNLDDEQLMFRRRKIAQNGLDLFRQEYPAEPDEAFLTTGRPVFNPEQLQVCLDEARDVKERLALEGDEWINNRRGELTTYFNHDPGERYVIGADVAMGVSNGDYLSCPGPRQQKETSRNLAWSSPPRLFRRNPLSPRDFYNDAMIIVENNSHGILTCTRLGKDMAYPHFYQTTEIDKVTERETTRLGFHTNVKTKPLVIDQLRASMREGELQLNDKTTIREMLTYIVTESGAMEAEAGCFDDCVMSLALANHIHEGAWDPVEVSEEHYIEMV